MEPVYVVALNYTDFKNWCRDHGVFPGDRSAVRHITEVAHIHGVVFAPAQVQYTERAHEHPDAAEIRYWITDRTTAAKP